jgi:hypothetical protein
MERKAQVSPGAVRDTVKAKKNCTSYVWGKFLPNKRPNELTNQGYDTTFAYFIVLYSKR